MKTIELSTQPPSLEAVLEAAAKEAGVVLTKSGQPVARVIPLPRAVKQRTAPLHPGAWTVREDFDEPLPKGFWLGSE
jgi:antitoxin (DNA-binding transcriptional repressor) of toxin-antitoxin stability system